MFHNINNCLLCRIGCLVFSVYFNILVIMCVGDPRIAWIITAVGSMIGVVIILCIAVIKIHKILVTIYAVWKNLFIFCCILTFIIVPSIISVLYYIELHNIYTNTTSPAKGQPWEPNLNARVWWQKPPSEEMENALRDTSEIFEITYERVDSIDNANLRI